MSKFFVVTLRVFYLLFTAFWLATSGCKKDGASTAGSGGTSIPIPKPGSYLYHTHGSDGVDGEMTTVYSNPRDSAGGKLETATSYIDTVTSVSTVFANKDFTIYSLTPPSIYWSTVNTIKSMPGVVSFTVNGWPMFMTMKNNAVTGNPLVFSGGPVTTTLVEVVDNKTFTVVWTMKDQNGKVVAINQPIVTDAGTFNCTEWTYDIETSFTSPGGSQIEILHETVWYSSEVGLVKSIEVTPQATNETILKKVL